MPGVGIFMVFITDSFVSPRFRAPKPVRSLPKAPLPEVSAETSLLG